MIHSIQTTDLCSHSSHCHHLKCLSYVPEWLAELSRLFVIMVELAKNQVPFAVAIIDGAAAKLNLS
jgi:hypothetical protein